MWLGLILASSGVLAAAPLQLAIANLAVSASDGGEPAIRPFASGDRVFVRFDVPGAARSKADDDADPRIKVSYRATLTDAAGVALAAPAVGEVVADLAPEDKDWMPRVRVEFELPATVIAGEARLAVAVRDEVAGSTAAATRMVSLTGPAVAENTPLGVLDFGFFRSENDAKPISPAVYRAGDTIWARFLIAGFARKENHRYGVAYGLETLGPDGKSLFRQEVAAEDQGEPAYPRRFVPAGLSVNLAGDLTPGTYKIRLLIQDRLGEASAAPEFPFTIE